MITANLSKDAAKGITTDYVRRLEEENARLLRRLVAAKSDVVWEGSAMLEHVVGTERYKTAMRTHTCGIHSSVALSKDKLGEDGEQVQVTVRRRR